MKNMQWLHELRRLPESETQITLGDQPGRRASGRGLHAARPVRAGTRVPAGKRQGMMYGGHDDAATRQLLVDEVAHQLLPVGIEIGGRFVQQPQHRVR